MDQIKIDMFIAQKRKEHSMTQKQLADQLDISSKTISKWETGKGLPEVSLMMPLCDNLGITVNELLLGEEVASENIAKSVDKNLLTLMSDKKQANLKLKLTAIVIIMMFISVISLLVIASFVELEPWLRITLVIGSLAILVLGIIVSATLDKDAGVYKCPHCDRDFVPTMSQYIKAMHSINYRYMKCPYCGERHWCKRHID